MAKMSGSSGSSWGSGEFANMPRQEKMQAYPKIQRGYTGYDDTIEGVDRTMKEENAQYKKYPSRQK